MTFGPTLGQLGISYFQFLVIATVVLCLISIIFILYYEEKARTSEVKKREDFLEEGGKPSQQLADPHPPVHYPCFVKAQIILVLFFLAIAIIIALVLSMTIQRVCLKTPDVMTHTWPVDIYNELAYVQQAAFFGSVNEATLKKTPFYSDHEALLNQTRKLALELFGTDNFFSKLEASNYKDALDLCNGTRSREWWPSPVWSELHPYNHHLQHALAEIKAFDCPKISIQAPIKEKLLRTFKQLIELINLSDCSRFHHFFEENWIMRTCGCQQFLMGLTACCLATLYAMMLIPLVSASQLTVRKLVFFFVFGFIFLRWFWSSQ